MRKRPGICSTCAGRGWITCGRRGHDTLRHRGCPCHGCPVCEGVGVVVVDDERAARYVTAYAERFGRAPRHLPGVLG